jgi:hypothetical protein
MDRSDWLLLFVAADPRRLVDPVRVQKGLFLLAMSDLVPPRQRYAFEPYAYGPMSRRLYGDVGELVARGLIERHEIPGQDWKPLRLAPWGAPQARRLRGLADPAALGELLAIRRQVDALGFRALLEQIYTRYPDYAVQSVFRRP